MPVNKKSGNLRFISYAYAIGSILVVLGHSTPTSESDIPVFIDSIRTFIYCFHMPLFFFIAGLLFKYTTDFCKKPYGVFIKNKFVRFLTPYFVFSAIGIIPKILLSNYVNNTVSFDFYYLFETIFNPRLNVWGHFWFLPALLIIYVFSYLILKCYSNKLLYAIFMAAVFVLAVFPIIVDWFSIKDICSNLIYFCSGILLCDFLVRKRNEIFKIPLAIITFALSVLLFVFFNCNSYFGYYFVRNIIFMIIAYLMLYSIFCITVFFEKRGNKLFDFFEGKTFSIYILSWPCQAIVEVIFNRILNFHWFITVPSMFIVGLLIPILILFIYSRLKYHPKFINLVIGLK